MKKRTVVFVKLLIPIGLLLVNATSLINRFVTTLPDFVTGCVMGFAITIMIGSLLKQKQLKQQSRDNQLQV